MDSSLTIGPIYLPVFRLRQEEQKVLLNFRFGNQMYPYVEIVKEHDAVRKQSTKRKKDGSLPKAPRIKTFEEIHLPIFAAIKSERVFVDLPVHFLERKGAKSGVIAFMTAVVNNRERRTSFMKKFGVLSDKVIPIISTYFYKTNEINTIVLQENDLRSTFSIIGFRTSLSTYKNDLAQINNVVKAQDYLIMDLECNDVDPEDIEIVEMMERLSDFNSCPVFMIRSALDKKMTNVGIQHGQVIATADNTLISRYKSLGASGFGDYVGVKRDDLQEGGTISPGFVYYDGTTNDFYGFRGSPKPVIEDFENIIIPAVLGCEATERMNDSGRPYLVDQNKGWAMLKGMEMGTESPRNQAKFKRIAMEHYLHCIRTKIDAGDFA